MNAYRWGFGLLAVALVAMLALAAAFGPGTRAVALAVAVAVAGLVVSAIYFIAGEDVHPHLRDRMRDLRARSGRPRV